ncbi:Translation initiation factor eIF-2B subunit beta [Thelohanellus kitauei]|uniref:Translation initiation factor eIF2B subunit beta n=1 Tax=Thelohanellus kitauei TaxID=669202 RepID=A0A0C2MN17_THEKT|nr:Translation initiation factor eIF-2B subunit beta [Thelohanellus kitauei]
MPNVLSDGSVELLKLIDSIKKRELISSSDLASKTFTAFLFLVSQFKFALILHSWSSRDELYDKVCFFVNKISQFCRPHAIAAENAALRVLKVTYNVFYSKESSDEKAFCHRTFLKQPGSVFRIPNDNDQILPEDISTYSSVLKEELHFLMAEFNNCRNDISGQSIQHVHTNETIMVHGYSQTVELFLRHAARKREFRVIVCQASPDNTGHLMVARLSELPKIEVSLIPDSSMYAVMARVNKVIISCYGIFADGALCTRSGILPLVICASTYGIPVMVCTGLHKLSPRYTISNTVCGRDVEPTLLGSPSLIIGHREASSMPYFEILNPLFEFVPADVINLFITNKGDVSPTYMYRLIKELYRIDDQK